MGRWKIPKKISDECLEYFKFEKYTQSEIARACNCSRQAINQRIRGYKPNHIPFSNNKKEYKVFWARIWGLSLKQISARFSFSKSTIQYYFMLHKECLSGYVRLKGGKQSYFSHIKSLSWETKAYWFRIQGLSWSEIAKRLNVNKSNFSHMVKNNPEIKIIKRGI